MKFIERLLFFEDPVFSNQYNQSNSFRRILASRWMSPMPHLRASASHVLVDDRMKPVECSRNPYVIKNIPCVKEMLRRRLIETVTGSLMKSTGLCMLS